MIFYCFLSFTIEGRWADCVPCACCFLWLLLVELLLCLWWNLTPPFQPEGFSVASQAAAFVTAAHHLLPTFLYILPKTSVPPPLSRARSPCFSIFPAPHPSLFCSFYRHYFTASSSHVHHLLLAQLIYFSFLRLLLWWLFFGFFFFFTFRG